MSRHNVERQDKLDMWLTSFEYQSSPEYPQIHHTIILILEQLIACYPQDGQAPMPPVALSAEIDMACRRFLTENLDALIARRLSEILPTLLAEIQAGSTKPKDPPWKY
jgi:hypothetical protein